MDELKKLFTQHQELCNACERLHSSGQCSLSHCNCKAWTRPRCPAGKWWDEEYNKIVATMQPQQL